MKDCTTNTSHSFGELTAIKTSLCKFKFSKSRLYWLYLKYFYFIYFFYIFLIYDFGMKYGKCWQVSWDSHSLTGEGEEQNTDVSVWIYVGFAGFSMLQRHPESSHGNTAGDSEKTNRVKLEEKLNYMQKKSDNTLQKACVSCRDLRQDSDDVMLMCVCVCDGDRRRADTLPQEAYSPTPSNKMRWHAGCSMAERAHG